MTGEEETMHFLARSLDVIELDHSVDVCGQCALRSIMRDVAQDTIVAVTITMAVASVAVNANAIEWRGVLTAHAREVERRWMNTKFVKLWKEEQDAGRDPHAAFAALGWDP